MNAAPWFASCLFLHVNVQGFEIKMLGPYPLSCIKKNPIFFCHGIFVFLFFDWLKNYYSFINPEFSPFCYISQECAAKGPRPRSPRVWKTNKKIGTISKSLKFVECVSSFTNFNISFLVNSSKN